MGSILLIISTHTSHQQLSRSSVLLNMDRIESNRDAARDAFMELCAAVDRMMEEKEEKREMARGRVDHIKGRYRNLRVRRTRLRMKYVALLEAYNELAEEMRERSDSESSSDEEDDDNCCIM